MEARFLAFLCNGRVYQLLPWSLHIYYVVEFMFICIWLPSFPSIFFSWLDMSEGV